MTKKKYILIFIIIAGLVMIGCPDKGGGGSKCTDDEDCDGVTNTWDNCYDTHNVDQADTDGDGIGDACDEIVITNVCDGVTHTSNGAKIKIEIHGRGGHSMKISLRKSSGKIAEKEVDIILEGKAIVEFDIDSNETYWWSGVITGANGDKTVSGKIKVDSSDQNCALTGPEDTDN